MPVQALPAAGKKSGPRLAQDSSHESCPRRRGRSLPRFGPGPHRDSPTNSWDEFVRLPAAGSLPAFPRKKNPPLRRRRNAV